MAIGGPAMRKPLLMFILVLSSGDSTSDLSILLIELESKAVATNNPEARLGHDCGLRSSIVAERTAGFGPAHLLFPRRETGLHLSEKVGPLPGQIMLFTYVLR